MSSEESFRKRLPHVQGVGAPPCSPSIDGRLPRPLSCQSASTQFVFAHFRPLPCDPDQPPEVAADVIVELFKHALAGVELEVLTPTAQQLVELVDCLKEAPAPSAPKDFVEFQFEPLEALGMHSRSP